MDLNWPAIIIGLAFSAVGFIYSSYGKRMKKTNLFITGLVLMFYSYGTESVLSTTAVGAALTALPFIFKWWR